MATEAINELPVPHVIAKKAVQELSVCHVTVKKPFGAQPFCNLSNAVGVMPPLPSCYSVMS